MAQDRRDPSTKRLIARSFGCASSIVLLSLLLLGLLVSSVPSCSFGGWTGMGGLSIDAGPGKGTESARLPVNVEPRVGLTDGTVVTVTSDAFEPHHVVGVAVCLREADVRARGVDACDEVKGARYAVGADGKFSATYPVPRVITIDGVAHDCASPRSGGCLVVAASASDYDRSGGQPISFRTDLGPPDLTPVTVRAGSDLLAVIPPDAGAVGPGVSVEVTASGFQPGEPVLMAYCVGFPNAPVTSCDPVDDQAAMASIMFRSVSQVKDTADQTGTSTFTFTALGTIDTYSGNQDPVSCASPDSACSFVITAAADTKRSAVVPYSVPR